MITLKDYLTASGRYPERENHKEVTEEVKKNAEELLKRVNALLNDLKLSGVKVSSGFRPSAVNASISNAAKKSLHMTGQAIDLADPTGAIDELLDESDVLLKKYGLWQEAPSATKGWAHIDIKNRGTRKKNQFLP